MNWKCIVAFNPSRILLFSVKVLSFSHSSLVRDLDAVAYLLWHFSAIVASMIHLISRPARAFQRLNVAMEERRRWSGPQPRREASTASHCAWPARRRMPPSIHLSIHPCDSCPNHPLTDSSTHNIWQEEDLAPLKLFPLIRGGSLHTCSAGVQTRTPPTGAALDKRCLSICLSVSLVRLLPVTRRCCDWFKLTQTQELWVSTVECKLHAGIRWHENCLQPGYTRSPSFVLCFWITTWFVFYP